MIVLNDLLWDGIYKIYQDENLFKFSLDSILISKFVTINKTCKKILDIGTGNAPIPMLLRRRCNSDIVGIEIQNESYNLGLKSIEYNKLKNIELVNDDVRKWYKEVLPNTFDTIISNPPFFKENSMKSSNKTKCKARSEVSLTFEDVIIISKKILKDHGNIAIVNRPDRLLSILVCLRNNGLEPKKIQFVYPRADKEAVLVMIEATKNGKVGLKILNPIYIQNEKNEYTNYIKNLLLNFEEV